MLPSPVKRRPACNTFICKLGRPDSTQIRRGPFYPGREVSSGAGTQIAMRPGRLARMAVADFGVRSARMTRRATRCSAQRRAMLRHNAFLPPSIQWARTVWRVSYPSSPHESPPTHSINRKTARRVRLLEIRSKACASRNARGSAKSLPPNELGSSRAPTDTWSTAAIRVNWVAARRFAPLS
jgi:hypothetical protein